MEEHPKLSMEQLSLIEQRVANENKSAGIAYLLWVFLGGLSIHNFYIGRWRLALVELGLAVLAVIAFVGGLSGIALEDNLGAGTGFGLWMLSFGLWGLLILSDLFTIPRGVRKYREKLRRRITDELLAAQA